MSNHTIKKEQGQTLVEFSLVIIVLLLLAFVIIESGRILWAWNTVQNAARDGARYGSTGQFDPAFQFENNPRVASIKNVTHANLAGLRLNEDPNALYEDDYYYNIEVLGVPLTDTTQFYPNNAGGPGLPMLVRVTYRVPLIAPILSGIVNSIPVRGQTVINNEQFGSLGNSDQGQGLPPPVPIIPTAGPTPSPSPSPTATATNTPGPAPTATVTASATPTGTPDICATHFEGDLIAGNNFAFVTGEPGDTIIVVDLTTGDTLGADVLVAVDGHDCPGFADFFPNNLFDQPLILDHVILVQSTNGTVDTAIVVAAASTPTPTPSATPTTSPTPTSTPTTTPSATPSSPYIVLSTNCATGPAIQFTVFGFGWPNSQDINLFFDNDLQTIIPAGHGGSLPPQTWTFPNVANGLHKVKAIALGGVQDEENFIVPCPNVTPTPATSTPTPTPAPADLVFVGQPELLSTPPIVEYRPLDFRVEISNTGSIDINDQFFIDIYFDPSVVFSTTIPITQSAGYMGVSSLPGGEGRTLFIRTFIGFSGGFPDHVVYSMVDSLEEVNEGSELNNIVGPIDVTDVVPAPSPVPTPIPAAGSNDISGVVRARLSDWFAQNRALVKLLDANSGAVLSLKFTNDDGIYEFLDLADGAYTLIGCQQIDNIWFQGLRTNIVVPPSTPLADIWLRDQQLGVCP